MSQESADQIAAINNARSMSAPAGSLPLSQAALESLPLPLSIYTPDGFYAGANSLVEQIFKVPKDVVVGVFNLLTDPNAQVNGTAEAFRSALAGTIAHAPIVYYEFTYPGTRNREQEGCYLDSTYFTFRDDAGNITHVGTLFNDVTEQAEAQQRLQTFVALAENASDSIGAIDLNGNFTYVNPAYQRLSGYSASMVGMKLTDLFLDQADALAGTMEALGTIGSWLGLLTLHRADGTTIPVSISAFSFQDEAGAVYGFGGHVRDMTADLAAEQERLALQEQIIAVQQAALRELSTPLIPVADDVVVMPLIGTMDSARVQQVIETLLTGVSELRARIAILDITGVSIVDTQVADGLIRAARAVSLLGAVVILTGIRPEVAQTLVQLGVDLSGIITRGSLKDGIAYALGTTTANT